MIAFCLRPLAALRRLLSRRRAVARARRMRERRIEALALAILTARVASGSLTATCSAREAAEFLENERTERRAVAKAVLGDLRTVKRLRDLGGDPLVDAAVEHLLGVARERGVAVPAVLLSDSREDKA